MRLPPFQYLAPENLGEALRILEEQQPAATVLAGGTELTPRLRMRLSRPGFLVSLKNLAELNGIQVEGARLTIGAMTPLGTVIHSPEIREHVPGLAEALTSVGSPGIQHHRGTIGGNLLIQTRCLQYNQSDWWRSGRERCFKNGGQVCQVLPDSRECSASCQSDGAIMLTALSAQAVLESSGGGREIPLTELYSGVGDAPFTLLPGELLTHIRIFIPTPSTGAAYEKLRWRSAIDYPLVSAAAVVSMSKGKVDRVRLVVGAAGPAPLVVEEADAILRGKAPERELIEQAARAAQRKAEGTIVENTIAPAEYRRSMVRVMTRRALARAVELAL